METNIDEKQSLEIIKEMIGRGKRNLKDGSQFYLIWGWAALIAALMHYSLINFAEYEHSWVTWPVTMIIAGAITGIVGMRIGKRQKFVSFTDSAMVYLWGGFLMYLFIVLMMSQVIGWTASYVLIIGLYGLGTFISGGILRFRPLIIGGLLSMALCTMAVFVPILTSTFSNVLLLLALSLVISYIVPGYILRAQHPNNAA